MEKNLISRKEPCRLCGSSKAVLCTPITYWDLQNCDLVECPQCKHIQLDPMLQDDSLEQGCFAYHIREISQIPLREQKRNLLRNFRRGVLFAFHLKRKNIIPHKILEFGPGSGYFMAGVKFIFPEAQVTVVDIVDDVLKRNKEIHGFSGTKSLPDRSPFPLKDSFDLIIARDIIEHVSDFAEMLKNVKLLLKNGGYFHYITPNGHQDCWGHRMQWQINQKASELLINHVNYFDGTGLLKFLEQNGFKKIEYYVYDFKEFLRGKGWKRILQWSTPSVRTQAQEIIRKKNILDETIFDRSEILNEWYVREDFKILTVFYSWLKHGVLIKINPRFKYGHEIFGTFQKITD